MIFVTTFDLSYLPNHVYMYICRSAVILFCHAKCIHVEHCKSIFIRYQEPL